MTFFLKFFEIFFRKFRPTNSGFSGVKKIFARFLDMVSLRFRALRIQIDAREPMRTKRTHYRYYDIINAQVGALLFQFDGSTYQL